MALIRCWSFVDLMFLEFFHFHCHMLSYDNRIKQLPFQVAAFKNKVFCGTYARGGDIFMSACQDRKVTDENGIFLRDFWNFNGLPQIRIYDTSQLGFKLVQTIEAQVCIWKCFFTSSSYFIKGRYQMISYRYQDVGWSVLDVALSPDGGHLVYSSWSDSLHQVLGTLRLRSWLW